MLSWRSFVCSLPHWPHCTFLTHLGLSQTLRRMITCTILCNWQMAYLACHVAEFRLKFKHDFCNFPAALQAQTGDLLGSAALLSSPLSSPTMPSSNVPTLSQQNHFMWLGTEGRGSLFSQTLCVYPIIPQKKFTSMRKKLGDLATSETCSHLHSQFPQGAGLIHGNVWIKGFVCVCSCKNIIGLKLPVSFMYGNIYN